jgi:DNA (cytosine-5)-methyltransferase 1
MKHGSLFSGIGGFDYAAEQMGWENLFHCEWNEFGQRVLKHYFPQAQLYNDITKSDFTIWRGKIDIITGGFPCQPYSQAGKRLGKEDDRHLWPEMLRAIREIQPTWVVGENVSGLINWNDGLVFDEVQADLEAEGYEVQPYVLPASGVNAPHRRDRIWFVAYKHGAGLQEARTEQQAARLKQHGELGGVVAYAKSNGGSRTPGGASGEVGRPDGQETQQLIKRCKIRTTPNPDRNGLDRRNDKHEVKPSEGRVDALGDIGSGGEHGDATNSENGGRGGGNGEQCSIRERKLFSGKSERREVGGQTSGCSGKQLTTMHTNGTSKQGEHIGQAREGKFNGSDSRDGFDNFQNFPTQSPICGGDDGLPTELDGITFPKWRNESIKAYGNAIVPQVALQIFRAIQQYEDTTRIK